MQRHRLRTLAIVVAVTAWVVVTPLVWRDLRNRPAEQVRGKKWMWRLATANLSGSIAYLLFGRRRPA